jgi:hypothetical protein
MSQSKFIRGVIATFAAITSFIIFLWIGEVAFSALRLNTDREPTLISVYGLINMMAAIYVFDYLYSARDFSWACYSDRQKKLLTILGAMLIVGFNTLVAMAFRPYHGDMADALKGIIGISVSGGIIWSMQQLYGIQIADHERKMKDQKRWNEILANSNRQETE